MADVKPITPKEVQEVKLNIHPDIIEIVNDLVSKKFRNGEAVVLQKDIISAFMKRNPSFSKDLLFDEGHMDFEPVYRKAGWKVEYEKPDYNGSGEANFKFSFKRKKTNSGPR